MVCLLLGLGWAATAQAKAYSLTGGGGQLAVAGDLPLPLQVFPTGVTGSVFPPLGVPANTAKIIRGTTAMSVQQKLTIPTGVLSRPPQQRTLGVFAQNPYLYAVATNLGFGWPAAAAVLSTGARTGAKTTTFVDPWGNTIRYSNALASKFGGPAYFAIAWGPPAGRLPGAPVTLYAIGMRPTGNPPCTHTSLTPTPFPGPGSPACFAQLGASGFSSVAAIGAHAHFANGNASWGGFPAPDPGLGFGKFGTNPLGTVDFFTFTPNGTMPGFSNAYGSVGYPWTTGMLTLSVPSAAVGAQMYTITGMDSRTKGGAGTIQLVAGSTSSRTAVGLTGNRGWIRLQLAQIPATPTLSPAGLAATVGLMLLAAGYAVRRRAST